MTRATSGSKYRIFLSHSRHDHWICHTIGEKIREAGADIWVDVFDLAAGRNIGEEIKAGLRQSQELLILISPASVGSDWVKHEAGIADVLDLPITLVMLHVDLDKRPEPLKDRLAISINDLPIYVESIRKKVEKA
jgi:hypothetical protein